jgi:hypothetical protein
MSPGLNIPLRSLRELYDEIAAQVLDREQQQEALILAKTEAELEIRFEEADALGDEHDRLDSELAPLLDRMEEIEEELAWIERGEDRRDNPMVL